MEGSQDASYAKFDSEGQSNNQNPAELSVKPSVSFQERPMAQREYNSDTDPRFQLTASEIGQLKLILGRGDAISLAATSLDSDYPQYEESTHAWAVFADNPKKRAGKWERAVGIVIIIFQLFAYRLFALEAIEDFQRGSVPVMVSHADCAAAYEQPNQNFTCEAQYTNTIDAFVAFFMLAIFLTKDFIQAGKSIRDSVGKGWVFGFALLAAVEVTSAFVAAGIAVSYHLFIGEVTDAVEVGVGLLFIRELSRQTYAGLKEGRGKNKQYKHFLAVLSILIVLGMCMDPLTAKIFAGYIQ
ncbi:unnamed protein product [Cylindrotheca closterium]|uniref:Uncharacterized protein n=1 Tax=Cylindrotheca closterium TaxID=2856 RepID=A0AAD2FK75_9STRA|nr:unnamed protein product [Cylindrotheca closterium]